MAAVAARPQAPGAPKCPSRPPGGQSGGTRARRPHPARPMVVIARAAPTARLELCVPLSCGLEVEAARQLLPELPRAAAPLLAAAAAAAGVSLDGLTLHSPYLTPLRRPHTACLPITLPPAAAAAALQLGWQPLSQPWPPAAQACFAPPGGPPCQRAELSGPLSGISVSDMAAALQHAFPGAVQHVSRPTHPHVGTSEPHFLLTLSHPSPTVPRRLSLEVAGQRVRATVRRLPRRLEPPPTAAATAAAPAPAAAAEQNH